MYRLHPLQLEVEFFIMLLKLVQNRGDEKMKNRSFLYLFGLMVSEPGVFRPVANVDS